MKELIDTAADIPKYHQLKELIKAKIKAGIYKVGSRLPTEIEMKQTFKLSGATVARAMRDMTLEGYLLRKRGGGTFVKSVTPRMTLNSIATPELIIECSHNWESEMINPLNWFISSQVHKGVINSYSGTIRLLDCMEISSALVINPGLRQERSRGSSLRRQEAMAGKRPLHKCQFPRDFGGRSCCDAAGRTPVANIILLNPKPGMVDELRATGAVFVVIDHDQKFKNSHNRVTWEQFSGVYELMSYLINDLGHREIGIIYGRSRHHQDRLAAYHIGLKTAGMTARDALVIGTDEGTEKSGYEMMKQILSSGQRPTAVFVDTDIKALGAMAAVREHGLQIPRDISIAGFDDVPGSEAVNPPLTTVRAPYYEMGCEAVRMLERRVSTGDDVPALTLKTILVKRESCGPVPNPEMSKRCFS
ncbi:MAG: GntR family transcriptional regulator [Kiritimatiellae bacterium]|nr:GntR family transcriptional regulator [Kiritimatiellia bacterium]